MWCTGDYLLKCILKKKVQWLLPDPRWFISPTVTVIILFSYLPSLQSFFPRHLISFVSASEKQACSKSSQRSECSYSAKFSAQAPGEDKWYELYGPTVKYSIQPQWDLQKSSLEASSLDCFSFLHSFPTNAICCCHERIKTKQKWWECTALFAEWKRWCVYREEGGGCPKVCSTHHQITSHPRTLSGASRPPMTVRALTVHVIVSLHKTLKPQ